MARTRVRRANCNLRTQLLRIMAKAGVPPWPRLFHNMRSSRQTEFTDLFPAHAVCHWMGNSQVVASRHYLQVRDAHFEMATAGIAAPGAAQKAAQSGAAPSGTGPQSHAA